MTMTEQRRSGGQSTATGVAGGGYGLGFLGALVYFIQAADSFWEGAYGVFQAIFWPAFLVYRVFEFVGA
jgi:hypothetical protein